MPSDFEHGESSYGERKGEEGTGVAVLPDSGISTRSVSDGSVEPSVINTQVELSVSQILCNTAGRTLISQFEDNPSLLDEQLFIHRTNRCSASSEADSKFTSHCPEKK